MANYVDELAVAINTPEKTTTGLLAVMLEWDIDFVLSNSMISVFDYPISLTGQQYYPTWTAPAMMWIHR